MAKRNRSITRHKHILKGRLFEFMLSELIERAGFNLQSDLPQLTRSKSKRRLHGRGSTYDPDFVGEFPMTIPFSYPFLLVGEAKNYSKPLGLPEVRSFLGAFIDVSQYARIDTKSKSLFKYTQIFVNKRYCYVPVIFCSGGFAKNAQALMWTHGIYFISYENCKIIDTIRTRIDATLSQIDFKEITKDDINKITSINALSNIRSVTKKEGFDKVFKRLSNTTNPIRSYFGILDNLWPVHFLSKSTRGVKPSLRIKECAYILNSNVLLLKRTTNKSSTTLGTIALPKHFVEEYKRIATKNNKKILQEITLFIPKDGRVFPQYITLKENKNASE